MPMFADLSSGGEAGADRGVEAPTAQVAEWLAAHIVDDSAAEEMVVSPTHSSPGRGWDAPLPPAGQIVQGGLSCLAPASFT